MDLPTSSTHNLVLEPPLSSIDRCVGARLSQWRQARGKSDCALAAEMGFSPSTLRAKEAGVSRLSVDDLFKVCRLLAVRPRDLLREDVAPEPASR